MLLGECTDHACTMTTPRGRHACGVDGDEYPVMGDNITAAVAAPQPPSPWIFSLRHAN